MRGSAARRALPFLAAILMASSTGCVTLDMFGAQAETAPKGTPCQVVATWSNQVVFTPDPTHNGTPTPGIAGRMYLFGPTICYPLGGDGSVIVDLWEAAQGIPPAETPPLEEWRIDPVTLHRLLRKDAIGWGYTLFLPWATYKPGISQVRMRIRYQPEQGTPLFAETAKLTLVNDDAERLVQTAQKRTAPKIGPVQTAAATQPAPEATARAK